MASAWLWVLVYIVGFCLFQVLLYRYLQRDETSFEQATPDFGDGDGETASRRVTPATTERDSREGVQCPHCGTYNENEQIYSYCRVCTEPLKGAP